MAVLTLRCPRCRKLRPLFSAPSKDDSIRSERVGAMCMECLSQVTPRGPVQVTKEREDVLHELPVEHETKKSKTYSFQKGRLVRK